jgi:hypothetical protein
VRDGPLETQLADLQKALDHERQVSAAERRRAELLQGSLTEAYRRLAVNMVPARVPTEEK